MKTTVAALAILCTLTLAAQPAPQPDAEVHNELRALKARLVDAINRNDIDAILAELHPNVVVTWQNAEVSHGREQVRAYLVRTTRGSNAIVRKYQANVDVDRLTTLYGGDTGVAYGSSRELFDLRGGMKFTLNGRWSATMVNENGRWLLASVHASSNLFDNPLVAATKKAAAIGMVVVGLVTLLIGYFGARFLSKRRP